MEDDAANDIWTYFTSNYESAYRVSSLDTGSERDWVRRMQLVLEDAASSRNHTLMCGIIMMIRMQKEGTVRGDMWQKSFDELSIEVEGFFKQAFVEYKEVWTALSNNKDIHPVTLVKTRNYNGLKSYLKKHRHDPSGFPICTRDAEQRNTMMHAAVALKDKRALRIMFEFEECNVLKFKVNRSGLDPLGLLLDTYTPESRDLFRLMISELGGCDLLHCKSRYSKCAIAIILDLMRFDESLYLGVLEDALEVLQKTGRLEGAFFEEIIPVDKCSSSEVDDQSYRSSQEGSDCSDPDFDPNLEEQDDKEEENNVVRGESDEENNEDSEHMWGRDHHSGSGSEGEFNLNEDEELRHIVQSDILRSFAWIRGELPSYDSERTLFHQILWHGNTSALYALLCYIPTLPEKFRKTALIELAGDNCRMQFTGFRLLVLSEILLSRKADMNARDSEGRTPLMLALLSDYPEFAKILISRGADTSIADNSGDTALTFAQRYGPEEIANLIQTKKLVARLDSSRSKNRSRPTIDSCKSCVVCYDRPAEVILAPCGHKILCRQDCKKIMSMPEEMRCCPVDKEKIESFVVRVFES